MINGKEYKIEKMNFARDNIPRSGFLKLGDDPIMLDYLANNKEQQHYPYYWVDADNNVRCHCFGNPIAKWEEQFDRYKCTKNTKEEGKCTLFLPVGQLYNN